MDLAICVGNYLPAQLVADVGRFAEDHGYSEVFLPDGTHGGTLDASGKLIKRDAFATFAAMFTATSRVRGTLGVAALPMHHRLGLPVTASTLHEMSGGRFSLGVGVAGPASAAAFGVAYPDKQIDFMRSWVRDLKSRSSEGMAYGGGWDVLIAALGPRMLQLGAQDADGLILNWLTPQHAAASVQGVRESAPDGSPPRVVLYLRLGTASALRDAAAGFDMNVSYHRHFVAQGLTTVDDIVAGATLPRDDLGAARARLDEYRTAGLDTVCLYPAGFDSDDRDALEDLTR